jgi:hypothetical protein
MMSEKPHHWENQLIAAGERLLQRFYKDARENKFFDLNIHGETQKPGRLEVFIRGGSSEKFTIPENDLTEQ